MEDFCGSKFWDINQTWYTDNPDFTPCFEQTVLVWIPSVFLWTFGTIEIVNGCWKRTRRRNFSFLHTFRQFIVITVTILQVLEFLNSFRPVSQETEMKIYPVEYVAAGMKAANSVWAFTLHHVNRSTGIRNSGVVFLFWLLTAACGAFEFRSALTNLPPHLSLDRNGIRAVTVLASYPFVVLQFILHFFSDSKRLSRSEYEILSEERDDPQEPCPEKLASFPSKLTFQWVWPILKLGYKKSLEFKDLWQLEPENKAQYLTKQFNESWRPVLLKCLEWNSRMKKQLFNNATQANSQRDDAQLLPSESEFENHKKANFLWTLTKVNLWYFMGAVALMLVYNFLLFVSPQLLDLLIQHVNSSEETWKGYLYAISLLLFNMMATVISGLHFQRMVTLGLRIRSAAVGAIYEKALVISNAAKKESTTGEIINLMSVDIQRIVSILLFINSIWSCPLQIALAIYFLYQTLGASVFAGVGTMVLLIPVNTFVTKQVQKLQVKQMKFKDQRVKLISEVLSGIKVLKLYAWEPFFERQVNEIREKELQVLKYSAYIDAFNEFIWYTAPFLVSLSTFGTYVLVSENNVLDARKAFVSLSLFNLMRKPLTMIPYMLVNTVQASVSVKRINKFLNAEEVSPADISHTEQNDGAAVSIENGAFAWDEKQEVTLENINISVPKGCLVAVVGAVGSGKSSLLAAMLGEIQKLRGSVNTVGSIAYVAQQAWIQNASLRDNILFGHEYTADTYDSVIDSCALLPDLEILPAGDKTEIGEKGINLSGGQKQRVSLARAVYSDADVYLLDDPLSAVDSHVGKQLFEKVIGPNGMLREKTRVMVTHSVTYLPSVDHIIVMSKGGIREAGTFQELIQKGGAFSEFLAQYGVAEDLEDAGASTSQDEAEFVGMGDGGKTNGKRKSADRLIQTETAETGSVKRNVYSHYLRSIGWKLGVATLVFHVLGHGFTAYSNVWLAKWSSEAPPLNRTEDIAKRDLYLGVYGGLGFGQAISIFLATLAMSLGGIRAAKFLHSTMLTRILRSPMSFFDTTPLGRVINRFSKDIDSIDYTFPTIIRAVMSYILELMATFIVISYSTPFFLVAIIPVGIVYFFIQRFYVETSRQVKRLHSVTRSPIFSHFTETLSGTATVRAFSSQQRFVEKCQKIVDENQRAYYISAMSDRWLGVRMEGLANIIAFLSALFAVVGRPSAGVAGLSISYALNITDILNWVVRLASQVETDAVAVERIKEYGEVSQEAPWIIPENIPSLSWPSQGTVTFNNYQTRYRDGMDLALQDVTFSIRSREKVGIVGRTGAGKSSMTLGLFRIIEAAGGSIEIDGINVSTLGLHDLRSRLTIIPQDPVLFSGSIRLNLDPFGKYTDDEVWTALEYAHLKEYVGTLASGLDHEVSEGGENLSVGQRQLVCLARALLRKTKILILDEATAAVDLETDDLIQRTIREKFKECTVLTIAHRLNTIMDYDRILVLDKGEIREFDNPGNLLRDQRSLFYSMAKTAGLA